MSKIFTFLEHSEIKIGEERDFENKTLSAKDRNYLETIEFQKTKVFQFLDSKTIKTSSIVGSISLKDGTIIEILPKILKEDLEKTNLEEYRKEFIKLIRLSNSKAIFGNFSSGKVKIGEVPLISYVLELFSNNLLTQLQKGVFRDYSETIESSSVIRGSIDIHKTILKHQFDRSQVVVKYRKHSENSLLMQIFKSIAILLLQDVGISYQTKKTLFETVEILADVENIKLRESDFGRVEFNRMNNQFQELFHQAKIIYSKYMPFSVQINSTPFWSILFDMNYLFENFIAYIFRKSGIIAKEQKSFEIYENVTIRPDFLIYENSEIVSVVDAKYKIFEKRPKREDIHQIVTYISNLNLERGYLIYPTFEDRENIIFEPKIKGGKEFEVIFLNIGNGIDGILDGFRFIFEKGKLRDEVVKIPKKEKIVVEKVVKTILSGKGKRKLRDIERTYGKDKNKVLLGASEIGNLEIVKYLVENGADVNYKCTNKATALILAIQDKRIDIVKYLLNNNANTNIQGERGITALIIAFQEDNLEMAELFIKNGANVDLQLDNGFSALILASFNNSIKAVQTLLKYNANINLKDEGFLSALDYARSRDNHEIVKLITDKLNQEKQDNFLKGQPDLFQENKTLFS